MQKPSPIYADQVDRLLAAIETVRHDPLIRSSPLRIEMLATMFETSAAQIQRFLTDRNLSLA